MGMRIYKTRHDDLATQVNVTSLDLRHNAISLNDMFDGAGGGVDDNGDVLFKLLRDWVEEGRSMDCQCRCFHGGEL